MGIFDRPKNYKMKRYSTIASYEERFQRFIEIINIVINDLHNPLLNQDDPKLEEKINNKLNDLRDNEEYCREYYLVNHKDLNELAFKIKNYIFYLLSIYKDKYPNLIADSENSFLIEIDIYTISSFSYDAKRWMIEINDEDLWYLGR